jgi:hypothetical protein
MESPEGNNRQYRNLNIDAKQAIGIDPRMESLYENIKNMEFQIYSGHHYDGTCFSRNGLQYRRGACPRQR